MRWLLALVLLMLSAAPVSAQIDLSRAGITRLDNGLTIIVLEDHTLPVVSVQVLYKSGSRDETTGKTGLAHFLEHLAFRASKNFPNGAATDAIYDAGGEWHGYTWIDQTTYFATVPASQLDLLLAIEADRMARVTIDPASIAAEQGAVISEMRGYQNDPSSVLFDAVAAAALQAHPYRNNTIGFESDVTALTAEDAEAFYAANYAPGNAVLAIVGDVDAKDALHRARAVFGSLAARNLAVRVKAVEPPQSGERRVTLHGPVERNYLRIAYPAPAFTSPDFPAFLLMQQLLSGGSGVNFRQNDWGTPTDTDATLHGVAEDIASWVVPTADPYLFMLTASSDDGLIALEREITDRINSFRAAMPEAAWLGAARVAVRTALIFDLETPEDAAHQLAYFEGLGGLDALLGLNAALDRVTPEDIQRIARTYLDPARRTVGWYLPGEASSPLEVASGEPDPVGDKHASSTARVNDPGPRLAYLANGLPVILRPIGYSPTIALHIVTSLGGSGTGYGVVTGEALPANLPDLIKRLANEARQITPPEAITRSSDPAARLEQIFNAMRPANFGPPGSAVVAVLSGEIDLQQALPVLEAGLGSVEVDKIETVAVGAPDPQLRTITERIDLPLAQAALGYAVDVAPPGSAEGLATRMLLYVLTHDYGGRLGDVAIRDQGLVYYIASDYLGDRSQGTVEISMGVDPNKIDKMEELLRSEIPRLASEPPIEAELTAARSHILGREVTAAMDNREIAQHLARTWLATGALPDREKLAQQLDAVTGADIARAAAQFATGSILRVDVGPAPKGETP